MKKITVAFVGNPNVGKTTILNAIAGTNLKVGNWAGVTVEKKEATVKYDGYEIHFVDLPGIYTLEPLSDAEKVAVNFLENEDVDVIVNVIDAQNFEKNMLLGIELLEFGKPTVFVLNMIDEAEKKGIEINDTLLSKMLNVSVVKTVGKEKKGIENILKEIVNVYEENKKPFELKYSSAVEEALKQLKEKLKRNVDKHFLLDLLEGKISDLNIDSQTLKKLKERLEKLFGESVEEIIKNERFGYAHGIAKEVVKKKKDKVKDITESLDNILLHPVIGLIIFVWIMYSVFKIAIDFSAPYVDWIDGFLNDFVSPLFLSLFNVLGLPEIVNKFWSEAVIGGVGFVLTFVPLIGTLFFLISFLEMSGYLPRIAVLMDRFMEKLGLHGNMLIPLILGFGCNVPAIMSARAIENPRDKFIVIMMIPFMSCPARLVVFAFFTVIFFDKPVLVILSFYLLGIVVAIFTAFLLKITKFKGEVIHFALELPPYRLPSLRSLLIISWIHVKDFIKKAGTIIFAVSIIIWVLMNLPPSAKNISDSYVAKIGKFITPVLEPIGIDDWRATTSLIPAFLARETAISSLGTMYSVEMPKTEKKINIGKEFVNQIKGFFDAVYTSVINTVKPGISAFEVSENENQSLRQIIKNSFNPLSALSFMIFLLIYNSCLATFAVMAQELSKKYAVLFLFYSFVIAWIIAFIVYHTGKLFINVV
jgi:ferrous iron transport protein B